MEREPEAKTLDLLWNGAGQLGLLLHQRRVRGLLLGARELEVVQLAADVAAVLRVLPPPRHVVQLEAQTLVWKQPRVRSQSHQRRNAQQAKPTDLQPSLPNEVVLAAVLERFADQRELGQLLAVKEEQRLLDLQSNSESAPIGRTRISHQLVVHPQQA